MFAFNGMREIVVHRIAGGCLFRTSSPQPDKVIIQKRTAAPSFMMSIENRIKQIETRNRLKSSSPRTFSIGQLNTLLCLHLRPIKLVVCKCPYSSRMGDLILRHVSRLDAFSVYHSRTRLLSYALGRTTDAPVVRPTRSSRTKVSSSQISFAHDR